MFAAPQCKNSVYWPSLCCANQSVLQPSEYGTVRVFIEWIRHHVQCAVLYNCSNVLILRWDFLSSASAVISCRYSDIEVTATDHAGIPDVQQQGLVAGANLVLNPGYETIFFDGCKCSDSDVFIIPFARLFARGILIATCLPCSLP